jgi:hypothetical protein
MIALTLKGYIMFALKPTPSLQFLPKRLLMDIAEIMCAEQGHWENDEYTCIFNTKWHSAKANPN